MAREENIEVSKVVGLQDAKFAGDKHLSKDCTLILVEGFSAGLFVKYGLELALLEDYYGLLCMNGLPLNTSEHKSKVEGDDELKYLKSALGLHFGRSYQNVNELRYGHLMIMADQDPAGTQIKGLIINTFSNLWPELLHINTFLQMFLTPVVTAIKQNNEIGENGVNHFFSIPEYKAWKLKMGNKTKEYTISYYKGLDSLPRKSAENYFRDMEGHRKQFIWDGDLDKQAIELAYSKSKEMKKVKKRWLLAEAGNDFDSTYKSIRYYEFFEKEWRRAVQDDVQRLIPSVVDGFKRGQRKGFFGMLTLDGDMASLSSATGSIAHRTFYPHRLNYLEETIINMAEDVPGTNNINVLVPVSEMGSKNGGRSNSAYPTIEVSYITRFIFLKEDDTYLTYLNEGGKFVEPKHYGPIIPMVLVNGCESIVNGLKTFVPKHDPRVIVAILKRLLEEDAEGMILMEDLIPYYKDFKGKIRKMESKNDGKAGYYTDGVIDQGDDASIITIKELPVRMTRQAYKKNFLDGAVKNGLIQSYEDHSTTSKVHIEITLSSAQLECEMPLLERFKLTSELRYDMMTLLDANNIPKKYDTPQSILLDYFPVRLQLYMKRKSAELEELWKKILLHRNIVNFINQVDSKNLSLSSKLSVGKLKDMNFRSLSFIKTEAKNKANYILSNENLAQVIAPFQVEETDPGTDFGYLRSIPWAAFKGDEVDEVDDCNFKEEMEKKLKEMETEFESLAGKSSKCLWLEDLEALLLKLHSLINDGLYMTLADLFGKKS